MINWSGKQYNSWIYSKNQRYIADSYAEPSTLSK